MYTMEVRNRSILLRTSGKAQELGNGNESIQSDGGQAFRHGSRESPSILPSRFRGRWLGSGNCAGEGPAQSSEPKKHRSKFVARQTTTRSLTGDAWDA